MPLLASIAYELMLVQVIGFCCNYDLIVGGEGVSMIKLKL